MAKSNAIKKNPIIELINARCLIEKINFIILTKDNHINNYERT
jgi:hypothetical protein